MADPIFCTRSDKIFGKRSGEAIGDCLGFKLTYKPAVFAALLTTLASGQSDIVISDIYATKERAKAADFTTCSKVFDGLLVAKGNPKGIHGIDLTGHGIQFALEWLLDLDRALRQLNGEERPGPASAFPVLPMMR